MARSTNSLTNSLFLPLRSNWSRISPTRRTAQSFSMNASPSSLLFSTNVAGKSNFCWVLADRALDNHLRRARLLVSPDHHELLAGEQVERVFRINAVDRVALRGLDGVEDELEPHAGQHGRLDAAVELADAVLDVLVGPDVFALAVVFADELVQAGGCSGRSRRRRRNILAWTLFSSLALATISSRSFRPSVGTPSVRKIT